jgi:hypothetical protein
VVAWEYLHSDVCARLVSVCKFLANIAILRLSGGGTQGPAGVASLLPGRPSAVSPPPPGRGGRRCCRRSRRRSHRRNRIILADPLLPVALIPNPDASKRVYVAATSRAPVDVTDKLATVSARRHHHDTEHLFALRTSHTAEHRAQRVPWAWYSTSLEALSLWSRGGMHFQASKLTPKQL